jgi:hypothetical protein
MGEAPLCDPTPLSTSVENKGPTPIRPTGDRPVEVSFWPCFDPESRCFLSRLLIAISRLQPPEPETNIRRIDLETSAIRCECKANQIENATKSSTDFVWWDGSRVSSLGRDGPGLFGLESPMHMWHSRPRLCKRHIHWEPRPWAYSYAHLALEKMKTKHSRGRLCHMYMVVSNFFFVR